MGFNSKTGKDLHTKNESLQVSNNFILLSFKKKITILRLEHAFPVSSAYNTLVLRFPSSGDCR